MRSQRNEWQFETRHKNVPLVLLLLLLLLFLFLFLLLVLQVETKFLLNWIQLTFSHRLLYADWENLLPVSGKLELSFPFFSRGKHLNRLFENRMPKSRNSKKSARQTIKKHPNTKFHFLVQWTRIIIRAPRLRKTITIFFFFVKWEIKSIFGLQSVRSKKFNAYDRIIINASCTNHSSYLRDLESRFAWIDALRNENEVKSKIGLLKLCVPLITRKNRKRRKENEGKSQNKPKENENKSQATFSLAYRKTGNVVGGKIIS